MHLPDNSALSPTLIPVKRVEKKLRVADFFAGVGGMSLGAARAGFDVLLAVENDEHAVAAHKLNFPNTKHLAADIKTLNGERILREAGLLPKELDGIVGGPPCQGFSAIGRRTVADPRNSLFRKFFELVAQCQPKFFVAENVPGILDPQYDGIRKDAFSLVNGDYILLDAMKLKASDFGAPTTRERVFFIGYRRDAMSPLSPADFDAPKVTAPTVVRDALSGLPPIRSDWIEESQGWRKVQALRSSEYGQRITGHIPTGVGDPESIRRYQDESVVSGCLGTRHTPDVGARYAALRPGGKDETSKAVRLKNNGLCPTLRAGTAADKGSYQAVRPIHPTSARVITPREAARLQGFPDWFRFAPSKWHSFRQIGNSVSPFVAEAVLSVIAKKLNAISHE